jgi:O-antigen/teichoic acid export membrane protein
VLGILINGYFSYKLFPSLTIRLRFDLSVFREIFRFSAFMAMNVLTGNIVVRVDKIIVGRYLGTQGVSYYNISFMVAQMGSAFIGAITQQLFPEVSSLQGAGECGQLTTLYQKACRYTFLIAFILTTLLIMLGDSFVGVWMGAAFAEKAKTLLPILAVVFFFSSITSTALWFYTGLGYTYVNLISSAIGSACYLVGAVHLIPRYGFLGTALAFCLILIPFPLYHGYLLRHVLKVKVGWYLSLLAKNMTLIGIALLAKQYMPATHLSILAIVAGGLIIAILCLFLSHLFQIIDLRELREILDKYRINRSEKTA